MKKIKFWKLFCCFALSLPVTAQAQLFNYKDYYSQATYSVTKRDNLKYGVGATNYYLYDGSGDKNSRSNYNHVTRKNLTLDLFEPNMGSNVGRRAVLIMVPGSGRDGCVLKGFCSQDTIKQNNIATNTADYISQEGNDYNELNTKNGLGSGFAKRGFVVVSPNTRYRYHNKQYNVSSANRWKRSDGSALFNGSSTHLEPLVVDIKRVVRWLSKNADQYNIDPNNIFIYGSSGAAKMASLAAITATNVLRTDDPAHSNSGNANYQFEVNNNNLSVSQKALRGAILLAGDTNGTRNIQLINSNTGAFMFWHGTTDRSILHGMAETIEEKCEYVGCSTEFYSLPGVQHESTAQGEMLHTRRANELVGIKAHAHDFIVNYLQKSSDNRAELSINSNKSSFRENNGNAQIEVTLSRALSQPVTFTMAADQMREVTQQNGAQGQYQYLQRFVANDSVSGGPVMYDQGTGVAFEKSSNLPASYKGLNLHTNGPGEGNPVLIPSSSDYFFNDFHGKKQVLTIPAGQTRATFNVSLVNDTLSEENECFKVRLLNAQGARIGNSVETITILDDDNPNAGNSISATCRNPGVTPPPPPPPPPAAPKISVKAKTVQESAGVASIQISSDIVAPQNITLSYRTVSGTASSANGDFTARQGQVTLQQGKQNVFVPITINNDAEVENNETFTFELLSVVSGSASIVAPRGTVTIVNDDVVSASLSVSSTFVSEASNTVNIKVTADRAVTENITFSYRTIAGTARSGSDYATKQSQITINTSQREVFIPVTINNDNVVEGDETFSFEIISIVGGRATIGTKRATVTIVDDDTLIQPTISVLPVNVKETSGTVYVTVSADQPVPEDVTVSYRTLVGSATVADNDYEFKQGTVTIRRSRDKVFVPITINNDSKIEGNEVFSVRINEVTSNNAIIGAAQAQVTIVEGNTAVRPSLSVIAQSVGEDVGNASVQVVADRTVTSDITFAYRTVVGTATSSSGDYVYKEGQATIRASQDRVTIPVTIRNDTRVEGNETFGFRILSIVAGNADVGTNQATITIVDDDRLIKSSISVNQTFVNEGSGTVYVRVIADRAVDRDVVLAYRTVIGTASSSKGDYVYKEGQVTVRQGREEAVIAVNINDDSIVEGIETFAIELVRVVSGNAVIGSRRGIVTIVDNDVASISASVDIRSTSVTEDAKTANVVVSLDRAMDEEIVIAYQTVSGTATEGVDYVLKKDVVRVKSGQTKAVISVSITDDLIDESNETFSVRLDRVVSGDATLNTSRATVTIVDNDSVSSESSDVASLISVIMMLLE